MATVAVAATVPKQGAARRQAGKELRPRRSVAGPEKSVLPCPMHKLPGCQPALLSPWRPATVRCVRSRASPGEEQGGAPQRKGLPEDDVDEGLIGAVGTWVLWAGLIAYAFYLAPNQTPLRDSYFVEKLSGLGSNDGVHINTIFTSLWFLMGLFPPLYASLLRPSAPNGNWLPAWPFLLGSVGFGAFALLPYFAMWEPSKDKPQVPPLAGDMDLGTRITESPIFAAGLLGTACWLMFQIATAGGQQWYQFGRLFEESRLVHVTTIDFFALSFALPFWMYNDASARGFKQEQLLPALIAFPVVGPALYLLLRPKGAGEESP